MEKDLIQLVKKARGNRSLREYAKESGVNVSIISRIESGEYRPGRKVLEKLASPDAKPQGGVTLEDLLSSVNNDKLYKKGMAAGMAAGSAVAGLVGVAPLALLGGPGITAALAVLGAGGVAATKAQTLLAVKEKEKNELMKQEKAEVSRYDMLNQEIQRFAATATGIIYGKLSELGIRFRPVCKDEVDTTLYDEDTLILIEEQNISSWLLSFVALSESDRGFDKILKQSAMKMFERLLYHAPDQRRKTSIVVNDESLFEHLVAYKGRNSYRGNLSIIQVDIKSVQVIREEYISYYNLDKPEELVLK